MQFYNFKKPAFYPAYLCLITLTSSALLYVIKFGIFALINDIKFIFAYSAMTFVMAILLIVYKGKCLFMPYIVISLALGAVILAYYSLI